LQSLERLKFRIATMLNRKVRIPVFLLVAVMLIIASGCISRKKINYFQDAKIADTMTEKMEAIQEQKIKQIKIRPYDILDIRVSTPSKEMNNLFNNLGGQRQNNNSARGGIETAYRTGYSVNEDGTLELPVIGTINVLNLTVQKTKSLIEDRLSEYVKDPYVQVKFLNYKVFVLGEVRNSGLITINNEQATVMEAISKAGGMGRFARRENVRVFRGTPDNPIVHEMDLTSVAAMGSPGYILGPYDIIYVEPLRRKNILSNINTVNAIVGILNTSISFLVILLTTDSI